MTIDEKKWLSDVSSLGCVVCRNLGFGDSPAEIHHIRSGIGRGQRSSHYEVIPLCPNHHRIGGYGVAFHAGPYEWIDRYGCEQSLLEKTIEDVRSLRAMRV